MANSLIAPVLALANTAPTPNSPNPAVKYGLSEIINVDPGWLCKKMLVDSPPECLHYYATNQSFTFKPVYKNENGGLAGMMPCVQIMRPDGLIRVNEPILGSLPSSPSGRIYGILGVINLLAGPYVIVVKERSLIGRIFGHPVWHVDKVDIWPCALDGDARLSSEEAGEEKEYLRLLSVFLNAGGFYYSPRYDLTSTLQRHHKDSGDLSKLLRINDSINNLFVANTALLGRLLNLVEHLPDSRLEDLLAICVYGFVEVKRIIDPILTGSSRPLDLIIISRRSTGRVGTRHHSRGIDDKGHVSNFVETEMIVIEYSDDNDDIRSDKPTRAASLLQIRGSIPLYWRQIVNLKYKPMIELYNYDSNEKVLKTHTGHLKERYGTPIVMVNLIDQKGHEGVMYRAFSMHMKQLNDPNIIDVHWDFHAHCKKLQWHNVSLLLDQLESSLGEIGWFEVGQGLNNTNDSNNNIFSIKREQHGITRTNCMDCLDRTNVVQSLIARNVLVKVLQSWYRQSMTTLPATLDVVFKNVWADNADAISEQYCGTGALKTDYTRTGTRTMAGAWKDLRIAMTRYVWSNFLDYARQDAMDLFFGAYSVYDGGVGVVKVNNTKSRRRVMRPSKYVRLVVPLGIVGLLTVFILQAILNRPPYHVFTILAYCLMIALVVYLVGQNGALFVELPRLQSPPMTLSRGVPGLLNSRPDPRFKEHLI